MKLFYRLLQIATRNVFRNKRRSVLSLLILVLGSTGLILVGGFFDNLLAELRETYIHSYAGHLQVNRVGYFNKGARAPFEYLMQNVPQVQELIEKQPGVLYTVPRLNFGGMLSTDNNSISVLALGVDPARERRMVSYKYAGLDVLSAGVIEGEELDPKDPYGILAGDGLMKALGIKVGDTVNFITSRDSGAIDGTQFHVRGVFRSALKEVGERVIKLKLSTAQDLLGLPDQIHSFLVILDRTDQTLAAQKILRAEFQSRSLPLEIIPWEEQGEIYRQSQKFLAQIYHVVQIILSIIFFLSIANTINMALFERMREYGTMMAIGNSRFVIFSMIFIEAAMIGLVGACLGCVVGTGVGHLVSMSGFQMSTPPVTASSIGTLPVMILISPQLLFEAWVISFAATTLSSIIPGYRAAHFPIIHALGYV